MIKPSRKLAVLAVTAGLMVSSFAVFAGDETVIYDQSNVGISAAVDRYVEATADTETATVKAAGEKDTTALKTSVNKGAVRSVKNTDDKKTDDQTTTADTQDTTNTEEVTTAADNKEATEYVGDALTAGYEGKAVVIADEPLNIRQEPSTEAVILGQLGNGSVVEVKKQAADWTLIRVNEIEGYVFSNYLRFGDEAESWVNNDTGKVAVITESGLRLRGSAADDGDILTLLGQGEAYRVLGYEGYWTKIGIDDDLVGYVYNAYVRIVDRADKDATVAAVLAAAAEKEDTEEVEEDSEEDTEETTEATTEAVEEDEDTDDEDAESVDEDEDDSDDESVDDSEEDDSEEDDSEDEASDDEDEDEEEEDTEEATEAPSDVPYNSMGEEVVAFATQFVGNPYVYGGSSLTDGADCSGFTMSVYEHFGYSLPHGATSQSYCGTEVSLDSIMPGDLLFYGEPGDYGHVTIYMGGGMVVHASTPETGIKISSYDYREPAKAVRIIQ